MIRIPLNGRVRIRLDKEAKGEGTISLDGKVVERLIIEPESVKDEIRRTRGTIIEIGPDVDLADVSKYGTSALRVNDRVVFPEIHADKTSVADEILIHASQLIELQREA